MSDYTKVYDGAAKDAAESVLSGADFDSEFALIATAANSKLDQLQGTDDLSFDMSAATRQIRGYESGSYKTSIQFKTDGDWVLYDDVGAASVFAWDRSAAKLLVYKSLEMSNANITLDASVGERAISFNNGTKSVYMYGQTDSDVGVYDSALGGVWYYNGVAGTFELQKPTSTGALTINGAVGGTGVKDEDTMSSDSATALATQQSIKAYVDAQVAAAVADLKKVSYGYAATNGTHNNSNESWTASNPSTGTVRVTHNLGNSNYVVTVSPDNTVGITRVIRQANYFDVALTDDTGSVISAFGILYHLIRDF